MSDLRVDARSEPLSEMVPRDNSTPMALTDLLKKTVLKRYIVLEECIANNVGDFFGYRVIRASGFLLDDIVDTLPVGFCRALCIRALHCFWIQSLRCARNC
ncbi:hypothetical protein CEXT_260071 [Caerostris extrusa]|uniref:Uncharacterized protein n=1 Tax=Caerostris extrusa TaxID=172846 RepID=A0AAV4VS94_CAEEX|nr:hypothetical protein CEXT_260071 [Caerostris extrusa]